MNITWFYLTILFTNGVKEETRDSDISRSKKEFAKRLNKYPDKIVSATLIKVDDSKEIYEVIMYYQG
jgi:hypothetical protein